MISAAMTTAFSRFLRVALNISRYRYIEHPDLFRNVRRHRRGRTVQGCESFGSLFPHDFLPAVISGVAFLNGDESPSASSTDFAAGDQFGLDGGAVFFRIDDVSFQVDYLVGRGRPQ